MDTAGSDTPDGKAPGEKAQGDAQPAPELRRDQLPVHEQIAAYLKESEGREQPTGDSVAAYYAAPLPERGKAVGRQTNWLLICSVIFVVMVAILGLVGWQAYRWAKSLGIVQNIPPPAAVLVGTPLTWTELDSWSSIQGRYAPVFGNGLVPGDFDGDGDDELMVYLSQKSSFQSQQSVNIYQMNGTFSTVPSLGQNYFGYLWAWDSDGNGTDEIVLSGYQGTSVYDHNGQHLTSIAGQPISSLDESLNLGDMDGNGVSEILLADPMNSSRIVAYDYQSQVVWDYTFTSMPWQMGTGDVDGDGLDELVCCFGNQAPQALGKGQGAQQISVWYSSTPYQGGYSFFNQLYCADLNGDGIDEIIDPAVGYIEPAAGTMTRFLMPTTSTGAAMGSTYTMFLRSIAAVCDINADGARDIAILYTATPQATQATAICIFDLSGTLVYHEEFGEEVYGIAVAQSGGQEHLVVLTASRLLTYP
jgi:hypothetical protein